MYRALAASRSCFLTMILFAGLALPVYASTLVLYPFTADLNPTITGSGITPTLTLSTLSNAYIGDDGFGNVLEAYPTSGSTSAPLALANNSFFTLSLEHFDWHSGRIFRPI